MYTLYRKDDFDLEITDTPRLLEGYARQEFRFQITRWGKLSSVVSNVFI